MQAEILTIGDELLIGQVIDTNSAWMATRLNECGIQLYQITSVHDDGKHIVSAIREAFTHADIVLTTGGLGPTKDDITKSVLADYFQTPLVENEDVHAHILDLYHDRPEVLNRLTATQWLVPASCTVLPNRVGSAPLMMFEHPLPKGRKGYLFCMPGVPYEMKIAMDEQIMPKLHELVLGTSCIVHRTVVVAGVPESNLALRIESWENALPKYLHLAYLPKAGMVRLRLSLYSQTIAEDEAHRLVDEQINALLAILGDDVILTDDVPLELAVGRILASRHQTISTAESCTGGRLAALLNAHPGSSAWYWGSVVAYDNRIKQQVLHVPADVLQTHGAVSEETVRAMAEGVRLLCNTDYAIATSGIAGPTGGSPSKPIGTVWIAWATPSGTQAECFHLGSLRDQITERACMRSLVRMLQLLQ